MKNESKTITVSPETQNWAILVAKLDTVYNEACQAAEDYLAEDVEETGLTQPYKTFRKQLLALMSENISQNICVNAHVI